jgi:hypothetical protein
VVDRAVGGREEALRMTRAGRGDGDGGRPLARRIAAALAIAAAAVVAVPAAGCGRGGVTGTPVAAATPDLPAYRPLAPPPPPLTPAPAPAADRGPFGASGKEGTLVPGEEKVLFERPGAGCLNHMWFGGTWPGWGETRIRVYVDGEPEPAIDMALALGHGLAPDVDEADAESPGAARGNARFGRTGEPAGVYNTYRMPFERGVKVTARLAPEVSQPQTFWWNVRGATGLTVRVGDLTLPQGARLRLRRREAVRLAPLEELALLDTGRDGLLYAVALAARSGNADFLQAGLRAYPGGATGPVWLSSGLADYFLGATDGGAGPSRLPLAGITRRTPSRFAAHRLHEADPIPFAGGLRLVWRNGEERHGHRYGDPQPTTLTAYVWTYEWE